jgi:hypothetical protein
MINAPLMHWDLSRIVPHPEVGNIIFKKILYPINIMAQKVIYYHVFKKVIYDSYHIISPIFDSTDFHD